MPGREGDYRRWQERTSQAARGFEGFQGTEQYPPKAEANEWVVVFRFSRLGQLTAWLDSGARHELLDEGRELFEESPAQEVLVGGTPVQDAVTAVISHDVRPEQEQDFVRWQDRILKAQEKFPGFMGSELFRPVEGVQDNWVVVFRFDTRRHLDDWLESTARDRLVKEGRDAFVSYDVHKVGSAFSGWFRFDQSPEQGAPPNWKQAMSVLLALYPTVMVLNLTLGRELQALGVPGFLGMFISNMASVIILTWLLMPLVSRGLEFWLVPGRARSRRIHVVGAAVVALCYVLLIVLFGLTTG